MPESRVQVQELSGTSWAVGVLFRPAAGRLLADAEPANLPVTGEHLDRAPHQSLADVMNGTVPLAEARLALVAILRAWLLPYVSELDERAALVNAVCQLAEDDDGILRSSELAERVNVPLRSLERLVYAHVGVTPKWLKPASGGWSSAWGAGLSPAGRLKGMDASPLNSIILAVVLAGIFFYVLYGVVRAAVRDGIGQAEERREKTGENVNVD